MKRIEILWSFYDKKLKKYTEAWLPGELIGQNSKGLEVRADNGFYAFDASPDCVREI